MNKISRIFRDFLNRHFPEQAYRFAPMAPAHLKPTPEQIGVLEQYCIHKIRLEFRRNVGVVIQRSCWVNGERDDFLPFELRALPRDVLLLTRTQERVFEIRAGESYWNMSSEVFEEVLEHLLASAIDSIHFTRQLDEQCRRGFEAKEVSR